MRFFGTESHNHARKMDVRFEIALGLDHLGNRGGEGGDAIVVPRNALVVEPIWRMVLESTGDRVSCARPIPCCRPACRRQRCDGGSRNVEVLHSTGNVSIESGPQFLNATFEVRIRLAISGRPGIHHTGMTTRTVRITMQYRERRVPCMAVIPSQAALTRGTQERTR